MPAVVTLTLNPAIEESAGVFLLKPSLKEFQDLMEAPDEARLVELGRMLVTGTAGAEMRPSAPAVTRSALPEPATSRRPCATGSRRRPRRS